MINATRSPGCTPCSVSTVANRADAVVQGGVAQDLLALPDGAAGSGRCSRESVTQRAMFDVGVMDTTLGGYPGGG